MRALLSLVVIGVFLASCVPSRTFEAQQSKLKEAEDKLRDAEEQAKDCDPNEFVQLKEQAQSLDLLSQELVDRNTELSKEVARLRGVETTCKSDANDCVRKLEAQKADYEAKIERTQKTYEDLIRELRSQIKRGEEALEKQIEATKALQKVRETKAAAPSPKAKPAVKEAPKAPANPGPVHKAQDAPPPKK